LGGDLSLGKHDERAPLIRRQPVLFVKAAGAPRFVRAACESSVEGVDVGSAEDGHSCSQSGRAQLRGAFGIVHNEFHRKPPEDLPFEEQLLVFSACLARGLPAALEL